MAGPCEHNKEPSISIKAGAFLDQLRDYLAKESTSGNVLASLSI